MRKPITRYDMNLYGLNMDDMIRVRPDLNLTYEFVTEKNLIDVARLRNNMRLREFRRILKQNSLGLVAYVDSEIAGYGWIKLEGCYDAFFRIGGDKGYLASFFVRPKYRGKNIYPNIIQELILKSNESYGTEYFLIGIQKENLASIRGASKVGFSYLRDYKIYRAFKMTIPKYTI